MRTTNPIVGILCASIVTNGIWIETSCFVICARIIISVIFVMQTDRTISMREYSDTNALEGTGALTLHLSLSEITPHCESISWNSITYVKMVTAQRISSLQFSAPTSI